MGRPAPEQQGCPLVRGLLRRRAAVKSSPNSNSLLDRAQDSAQASLRLPLRRRTRVTRVTAASSTLLAFAIGGVVDLDPFSLNLWSAQAAAREAAKPATCQGPGLMETTNQRLREEDGLHGCPQEVPRRAA